MNSKLVLFISVILLTIPCSQVFAAIEILDQKQEIHNTAQQILALEPIGQTFIPTISPLSAVEIRVYTQNSGFGDDTLTCRIRDSTINGTILGTASQSLTDGFGGTDNNAAVWLRFGFSPPITVTPNSTYVIELDANVATFGWNIQNGGNPYPDGGLIAYGGSPSSTSDRTFRTYSQEYEPTPEPAPVGGVASPINKLEILAPYLVLAGLIAAVSTVYVMRRHKN